MFSEKVFNSLTVTHEFKENRNYDNNDLTKEYHAGVDFIHKDGKHMPIMNSINGLMESFEHNHKSYGNRVILRHNAKYAGGVDEEFFSSYCHLHNVNSEAMQQRLLLNGTVLGFMGNTGNSWTKTKNGYRPVTLAEKLDPNEKAGVHLHYEIFQTCSNMNSDLFNALMRLNLLGENDYFYQWNRLYFNPLVIHKYFEHLKIIGE